MLKYLFSKQLKFKNTFALVAIIFSIIALINTTKVYADEFVPNPSCIGPALDEYVGEVIATARGCATSTELNGVGIFTGGDASGLAYIQATQPNMVVLLDDFAKASAIKSVSPGTKIVGRSTSFSDVIPVGLDMNAYKNELKNMINAYPGVDVWQGYHEAVYHLINPINDGTEVSAPEAYNWLKRHDIATIEVGNETGKAVCIGNFKEGWPRAPGDIGTSHFNDYVSGVMSAASNASVPVYLCVHEHESATSNSGNWTFGTRYNGWFVKTKNAGLNLPVLVTVAGYDSESGPVVDAGLGWKDANIPASTYSTMLKSYYDSAMAAGAEGVAVFSGGLAGWEKYDITELLTANIDPSCTGDSLEHIKLLSPAFNMTNNIGAQIAANMDPDIFSRLDGIAGNAYITSDNSILGWVANFFTVSGIGYSKPVMITETGDVTNGVGDPNTSLQALGNDLDVVKNGEHNTGTGIIKFLGGLLFNPFEGTNPSWAQFNLSDDEITTQVCRGNCSGIGANTASFYKHEEAYTKAAGLGMSYVLEISNIDESTIEGVLAAVNSGLKPIIRVGTATSAGPTAFAYGSYLKQLDSQLPEGSTVYAIAGPNEPQSECWATPQCGCDLYPEVPLITIKGRVMSPSGKPTNGVVVQEYKGTFHTAIDPAYDYSIATRGNVSGTDEKGNIVRGKLVDFNARNYADGVAVSGRLTTDPNPRLPNESDGCYPQGNGSNCAGYFSFDTYQIAHANRSHIGFFCGGSPIPRALFLVSLSGNVDLGDITVDCPETNTVSPAPMQIKTSSANYLTCHQGEEFPAPDGIATTSEVTTVAVRTEEGIDNTFYGNPLDPEPGEIGIPDSNILPAGSGDDLKDLKTPFKPTIDVATSTILAEDPTKISKNLFVPFGIGGRSGDQIPVHDSEIQLPDCNEFRYSNSILGNQEEYPGINSKSSVGYAFNLALPGTTQCILDRGIASGMIDPNRYVCVLEGEKKTLQNLIDIGPEWRPLEALLGAEALTISQQYKTKVANSSVTSDPRTTPQTAAETGVNPFQGDIKYESLTQPEGINSFSAVKFLIAMGMYDQGAISECPSIGSLANAILFPSLAPQHPLEINIENISNTVPSVKVEDVGLVFDYCTYNVIAANPAEENYNNITRLGTNHPNAILGSFKNADNPDPITTVLGKPISAGSNVIANVIDFFKVFFGITKQNAVVGGECIPQLDWCAWESNPDCTLSCFLFNASGEKFDCSLEDQVTVCGNQANYPYLSPELLELGYTSAECNFSGPGTIGGYNTGNESPACVGDGIVNTVNETFSPFSLTQDPTKKITAGHLSLLFPTEQVVLKRSAKVFHNITPGAFPSSKAPAGNPTQDFPKDTQAQIPVESGRFPEPIQTSYLPFNEGGGDYGECEIPPDDNLCSVARMRQYFSTDKAAEEAAVICYKESGGVPDRLNDACTYSNNGIDDDEDGLIDLVDPDYDNATSDYSVGLFQINLVITGRCPGGDGISSYEPGPPATCEVSSQQNLDLCQAHFSQNATDPAIIDGENGILWAVDRSNDGENWSAWAAATFCGIN